MTRDDTHAWHVSINRFTNEKLPKPIDFNEWPHFMYEAKDAATEIPRLAALFRMEREGTLPQEHQQCSRQDPEPITNRLTCCLGVVCSECAYLLALGRAEGVPPEKIDEMKAWTCAAHILMSGGDRANEGYILTTSDRMYWDRVYTSLASTEEEEVNP